MYKRSCLAICVGDSCVHAPNPGCARLPPLQAVLALPDFVAEHEQDLARQPLMDYGIAADSDETPLPHLSGLKAAGG